MAIAPATAPDHLPSLAEPVTFAGADADAFLRELPQELSPATIADLRGRVAAATAAISSDPASALFE